MTEGDGSVWLVKRVDGAVVRRLRVLPLLLADGDVPLLVVNHDQGGVGGSGLYYMMGHMELMLDIRWDAFHRGVRDIAGACGHASNGLFRRIMLITSLIFGLDYGPFGSGAFFVEKKQMLEYFYCMLDSSSPEFRKYADKFAKSIGMPAVSAADYDALFDALTDMASFNFKGPLCKIARWFAWWELCLFHLPELWGLKCVLEFYFDLSGKPQLGSMPLGSAADPREELRRLRIANGGFRLAWSLIDESLVLYTDALFLIGQPSWTAHSKRAEKIKSPIQGAVHNGRMSRGGWRREVNDIITAGLRHPGNHIRLGILSPTSDLVRSATLTADIAGLTMGLAGFRFWTAMLEFGLPLLRYSAVIASDRQWRTEAVALVRNDFSAMKNWEEAALVDSGAREVNDAMPFKDRKPVRIMWELHEAAGYDPLDQMCQRFSRTAFEVLPDSRVIEEIHQYLRDHENYEE